MSREIPNELEERRVIRLLAGGAETVPPLHDVEVETLVRVATARPRAHRGSRHHVVRRPLAAAAVAAAAVLAALLPTHSQEPERHSTPPSTTVGAHTIAFPEGSALSLLLSRRGERRA